MRKNSILKLAALVLILTACGEGPTEKYFSENNVALMGYDVVSYFNEDKPMQGNVKFISEYDGVIYQFASNEHKVLFDKAPENFLPSYGGWCAYAVAEGATKMKPNPLNWQIQEGKLQLFVENWQTKLMGSLKDEWNSNPTAFRQKADDNWEIMN